MDFTLSKEQQDIIKAAREFASGEFPDRAQEFDRNESFDLDLWRKACELGFVGVFIDEALQMHGGYGYIDEYKVQRLYRDAKILEIYKGTKEMEKTIVSRAVLG